MRNMVAIFNTSFDAAFVSLGTTSLSLKIFPIMNIAINGADFGTSNTIAISAICGKTSFSNFETSLGGAITIWRSFSVVNSFISGGCINATDAIYE